MQEARKLYENMAGNLAKEIGKHQKLVSSKIGILGVLWPSKRFADDELVPGQIAASLEGLSEQENLLARLEESRHLFDGVDSHKIIDEAIESLKLFGDDENSVVVFAECMQKLIGGIKSNLSGEPEDLAAIGLPKIPTDELLDRLADTKAQEAEVNTSGAAEITDDESSDGTEETSGGASGGVFSFDRLINGARNVFNLTTYYQMKERAGKVGELGLAPVLNEIRKSATVCKLHLVGHSFGGRLVSMAVSKSESNLKINSLALLQAAFSHYGFATDFDEEGANGAFLNVVTNKKVTGPIIISHTRNDKAVGLAYAVASRIARQSGAFF